MKWTRIETEEDLPDENLDVLMHILSPDYGEYIELGQFNDDMRVWTDRQGRHLSEIEHTIIGWAPANQMPDYEDEGRHIQFVAW